MRTHVTIGMIIGVLLSVTSREQARAAEAPASVTIVPRSPPNSLSIPSIDFREFYVFGRYAPELTAKALALAGKRVTLVGFMVQLETAALGGFYLSSYPTSADESGAGRGDVPPNAVFVTLGAAKGKAVTFVGGPLEVTGVLELGNRDIDGESTTIRLVVDDLRQIKFARIRSTARARASRARIPVPTKK